MQEPNSYPPFGSLDIINQLRICDNWSWSHWNIGSLEYLLTIIEWLYAPVYGTEFMLEPEPETPPKLHGALQKILSPAAACD